MPTHIPVLLKEVLRIFSGKKIETFFDGTLGLGGHAKALLQEHPEIQRYIGCDQDPFAIEQAKKNLEPWKEKMIFVQKNFSKIDEIIQEKQSLDGFLCDIGVSSMQLDQGHRGFSFSKKGPLDMRMNPENSLDAQTIVNSFSEEQLGKIFKELGEERHWRILAKKIVARRIEKKFETTEELADFIRSNIRKSKKHLDPATLVFQGLRIYVNDELNVLQTFLPKATRALKIEGIGAVISFHSLEESIVKNYIREGFSQDLVTGKKDYYIQPLFKKPITATEDEEKQNPRARSAKLRAYTKIKEEIC